MGAVPGCSTRSLDVMEKRDIVKRAASIKGAVVVNSARLNPPNPRLKSPPLFLARGYYLDENFRCRDCGRDQTWTSSQQKWWYEAAKANVRTKAVRCRSCRRNELRRIAEARAIHLRGVKGKRIHDI
jgi:hypothetical protein